MGLFSKLFSRRRRYDDISVSIQEHVAERAEELMAEGMPRAEAEQTARREFGNVTLMEERSREAWQWAWLESALSDMRFALRRLKKAPGFAVTILLTLAIGIGANTAVFSVVNSVLLKPLPYPDSGQLVDLRLDAPGMGGLSSTSDGLRLSASMYLTFSRHNQSFESMGVWAMQNANVTGMAQPDEVDAAVVSGGVLETLGVPPLMGRWLSAGDQDPRGAKTVMLSYAYWQKRFGGDRGVLGRSIDVDGVTRTIVGVMPRDFRVVDDHFELIVPIAFDPTNEKLAGFGLVGIGRLKPGVTLAAANADISRLIGVWMNEWTNGPGTNPHYYEVWKITPHFMPLKQAVIGNVGQILWVVMATVGLVMLIACVNVANLLMVRAEARQQELSIRAALGAGRGRIARELLIESVMLGLLGGVLSIGVAMAGLRLLVALGPTDLPRLSEVGFDAGSLGFTFALAVFSGLLFGSIPALKYAGAKATAMMGGTSRTASAGRARQRSRNVMVVAQVAMALVLLVCSVLMIRTFMALRNVDPGFNDAAHIETLNIYIPKQVAQDPHMVARMQREIGDRLAAIPGVASVGFAANVPMDGAGENWDVVAVEGKVYPGGDGPLELFNYVSPEYFQTMGAHLVAGRDFTWDDLEGVRPMIMVSESFARENWGSAGAAIGKRMKKYDKSPWQEVIGVVEDVHVHGVDAKAPKIVYWPAVFYDRFDTPPTMNGLRFACYAIHTSRAGTEGLLNQMQQAVWGVNGDLPLAQVGTMQELYSKSMARTSFTLVMLAIAGSMALALSIIGIYGVISYSVSQRTREIGIRLALGAQKDELRWMFVRSAMVLTVVGVVIGVGAAAGLVSLMKTLLFGVSPLDPVSFVAVPLVLAAAAALASYLPARRAASVDPVVALRAE
ncbi:ABC transporter permease [Terracidiphilus gabretensis]|uniref:ABC transporter permease n=1 Tax=Terracidiphilus gabretensis TaxID=1577687 RepID=UPI00071C1639|nr:ABC transporter permease [Terracidiphilus gabretensis]